jgi:hypothetical protein
MTFEVKELFDQPAILKQEVAFTFNHSVGFPDWKTYWILDINGF